MRFDQLVSTPGAAKQEGQTAGFAHSSADVTLPNVTLAAPADSERAERRVLSALGAESIPLTLWQLHVRTGVPHSELQRIITRLCISRSVRRLNTLIESFSASIVASVPTFGAPSGAAVESSRPLRPQAVASSPPFVDCL